MLDTTAGIAASVPPDSGYHRSSLGSSRWEAGGGGGGRGPAAWDRVRVDGGSGGGGGCRGGGDGRGDSELRGAAARTSAVIFHTMC
ncbi:Protein Shisa-6 [Manis pentadactyla]|nr:Protein Shisa-6 [Manis pentadactyla]